MIRPSVVGGRRRRRVGEVELGRYLPVPLTYVALPRRRASRKYVTVFTNRRTTRDRLAVDTREVEGQPLTRSTPAIVTERLDQFGTPLLGSGGKAAFTWRPRIKSRAKFSCLSFFGSGGT